MVTGLRLEPTREQPHLPMHPHCTCHSREDTPRGLEEMSFNPLD